MHCISYSTLLREGFKKDNKLQRCYNTMLLKQLARACGVPVGWRSGSRLATMLVAAKNNILFSFGTSVRRSSGRRSGVAVRAVDCWQ